MKAPILSLFLAAGILMTGCAGSQATAQSGLTAGPGPDYIYVCNQGEATVSIIDSATNTIVETIDLTTMGFPANAKPHHVVVEPDGSFWYLSLIGANRVLKFNRDNEVVGTAELQVPGMMALSPSTGMLYVGRSMSAVNPPQSIGVVERSSMDVDEAEVFFPRPHALALSPDGRFVYSASLGENRMVTLDQESGDGTFMEFPGEIHSLVQFAVAPDGQTAIVGGELTSELFFLDLSQSPKVSIRSQLTVGNRPWHPIFAADGHHAYFGNKGANTISVVDTRTGTVVKEISGEGIAEPHGSAISADGRYVYISQQNTGGPMDMSPGSSMDHSGHAMKGMVVVVDTQTNEIAKVIEVGMLPSGVGSRGVQR